MFRIKFSHSWTIPVAREQVWMIFHRAFRNSLEVAPWPHRFNEIYALIDHQSELKAKTPLTIRYKLGLLRLKCAYEIQQIIPEQRLIYHTREDHPLEGESEIELLDSVSGTEVHWYGYYEPKSFSSIGTLLFIKFFFDKFFFSELMRTTKKAKKVRKSKHRIYIDKTA